MTRRQFLIRHRLGRCGNYFQLRYRNRQAVLDFVPIFAICLAYGLHLIEGTAMAKIDVPAETLEQFCRKNRIRKLSLFGSVLRNDFRQESDIDVLVEFEKNGIPGLLGISRMERELSQIFGGRKIDLRTPEDLSKYFRQQVLSTAEVQYAA
ncbi:MAG: nucleotidyltransferase family protein [Desulfosudis oleivorans]|nr:nucleotidyltransferase family protein [Desulfosudis oleivorans]